MKAEDLLKMCTDAVAKGQRDIILVNAGLRAPFPRKGFPRPELLCNNSEGNSVWAYPAQKLLKALESHGVRMVEKC